MILKGLREIARRVLPKSFLRRLSLIARSILPRRSRFSQTYRRRVWGQPKIGGERFYSGPGSDPEVTTAYVRFVTDLIRRHNIRTVVDIGCGDFRVGRQLIAANPMITYVGADIVPELIHHNREVHGSLPQVTFERVDAVTDPLPPGDLILIRQVLQHLSNADILRVLAKLRSFPWVLITDAVPAGATPQRNEDIQTGDGTRPRGLFLEEAPFHLRAKIVLTTHYYTLDGRLIDDIRTLQAVNDNVPDGPQQ